LRSTRAKAAGGGGARGCLVLFVFKFDICVVCLFIKPNNEVGVAFKFDICVVCSFIDNVEFVENCSNLLLF
jgi:hypothetical protein